MPESVTSKQMEPVFLKNQGEELQKFTDVSGTLLARDWKGFGNQAQTLTAKGQSNWTGSFVSEDIESIEKSKTIGNDEPTVIHLKNGETMTSDNNTSNLIIRKLTPKECFRLMGFEDKDVDILVENNISNTQLYKMAGNSIVVDVLEEIFVELLNQYEDVFPIED